MLSDCCRPFALRLQELVLQVARRGVIVVDAEDADAFLRPFPSEPRRHFGLHLHAAAVIGDETDRLETAGLEAARDIFKHAGINRLGDADRARKPHMPGRWRKLSFW